MGQDLNSWRELVTSGARGVPMEKLLKRTSDGLVIEPLYVDRPDDPPPPGAAPFIRGAATEAFKVCVRGSAGTDIAAAAKDGAEALWCDVADEALYKDARARGVLVVQEASLGGDANPAQEGLWSSVDWIDAMTRGVLPTDTELGAWPLAPIASEAPDGARCIHIGGLAFHDLGASPADELALMMSSLVANLAALEEAGVDLVRAERMAWAQVAVGRDTFGELCKLRALRVLWHKVWAAAGVPDARLDALHAVCSSRTLSLRDPWVNMLRVTTQVFAAVLGGAQLVTPLPYDAALAERSELGERLARNTALVLREESHLGRVLDPGGGSYYIESRTDALAREAWDRFTAIENDGGIVAMLRDGRLHRRLEEAWAARSADLAKRKEPVLGVSEFANPSEPAPGAPAEMPGVRRDAEAFEALRAAISEGPRPVAIVALGTPAEHRARVGYAENFFGVAGLTATQNNSEAKADVVCLCGSDERYASEAAQAAREQKAQGARRVVLAGRPGANEAELREAGVDAFIYVGCDVLSTLKEVLS